MKDAGLRAFRQLNRLPERGYSPTLRRRRNPHGQDGAERLRHAARLSIRSGRLCSTVDDWLAFQRMLLAGGELGGKKPLSPESVRDDQPAHRRPAQGVANSLMPGMLDAAGWGYGMGVQVAPIPTRMLGA
jgi:CubicO group peptidase (beta-lactamase class C family)